MTMLDRMRRHKGWLKWSLAIVVLAFIFLYIPSFLDEPGARGPQRRGGVRGRAQHHRRPVPAHVPAADAGVPRRVRRQRRRAAAQTARPRPAHRPADDRRGDRAGRGRAAGHLRDRRGGPGADCRRCPGSRRTASSSGKSDTGSCSRCGTRRCARMSSKRKSAAGVTVEKLQGAITGWITLSDKEVERRVQAAQRQGQAVRGGVSRRQVPRGSRGDGCGDSRRTSRSTRTS